MRSAENRTKGALRRSINAWEQMGASEFILDVIKDGYKIPFVETPEPAKFKNNKSATKIVNL